MDYQTILADSSNSSEERIQAVFQLMLDGSEAAIESICRALLEDPSPIVRHECAYILGEIENDKGSESLIKAIQTDKTSIVKHEAALALSNRGHPRALEVIKPLLSHTDPDVVSTGEISIERWKMSLDDRKIKDLKEAEEIILDLTTHPEHRIQSAFLLLEDNSEHSIEVLLEALEQETNKIVKHEIIFCLGEVASYQVVNPLIRHMLEDPNTFVKHEAALALGTIGHLSSSDSIIVLLNHDDPIVVESAEIGLERLKQ